MVHRAKSHLILKRAVVLQRKTKELLQEVSLATTFHPSCSKRSSKRATLCRHQSSVVQFQSFCKGSMWLPWRGRARAKLAPSRFLSSRNCKNIRQWSAVAASFCHQRENWPCKLQHISKCSPRTPILPHVSLSEEMTWKTNSSASFWTQTL